MISIAHASAAFLLCLLASPVLAQEPTFDMSPEAPLVPEDAPASIDLPAVAPEDGAPGAAADEERRRYVFPREDISLLGETASRRWLVFLDEDQVDARSITLAYQNAIVVAPEISRLSLAINGTTLINEPISAPSDLQQITRNMPDGLLRPGGNDFFLQAVQRHRTDCSIESTYELWTEIAPGQSYLSYSDEQAYSTSINGVSGLDTDEFGFLNVAIVAPGIQANQRREETIRLAEIIALYSQSSTIEVSVDDAMPDDPSAFQLIALLGTADELDRLDLDRSEPVSDDNRLSYDEEGAARLVVTAESSQALQRQVEELARGIDRSLGEPRAVFTTESWSLPNAPFIDSSRRIDFRSLGIDTVQFDGRRYVSRFDFALPADFYAEAYGEAQVQLDAAFASTVLPGSRIDIFVNDQIASTTPLTSSRGMAFDHRPIAVPMSNFEPGLNELRLEAALLTDQDIECAPGATGPAPARFAISDESEFFMPSFARIQQRPDLAATGGTGFPYNNDPDPIPLVMTSTGNEAISSVATLMARMSVAAGRSIPVSILSSQAGIGEGNALFFGPVADMTDDVLGQFGIAQAARGEWTDNDSNQTAGPVSTEGTFQEFRDELDESVLRRALTDFGEWLNSSFDISIDVLRLAPPSDDEFMPPETASFLVAQAGNPGSTATWTLLTAPTVDLLRDGVSELVQPQNWDALSGRLAYLDRSAAEFRFLPVGAQDLVQSVPFSFNNMRLVVTNWLSTNILSYALLLVVLCATLGAITVVLLRNLGRRS